MNLKTLFRRAGRRTNIALFAVVIGAFLSGWAAFAAGTAVPATSATVAHGVFGIGVVLLVPWKSVVISRAPAIRWASLALLVLILLCVVAGFVQVFVGYRFFLGVTPIQVHVGAALIAVPLFAWHVIRHRRRQRLQRRDLSRRALLRTAAFTAAAGGSWLAMEGVGSWTGSPAASRIATGSHELAAADIPATIWLLDSVPVLDPATHRLMIGDHTWSVAELDALAAAESLAVAARLDCTSGWYADASWIGVPLDRLLDNTSPSAGSSIEVVSTTGYTRHFPVAEAGALWLVTRRNGVPLGVGTGAPVRLVAPGRRGFWWVKWVATVRVSDRPDWWQPPFPLQ
ncbi:molybdopterin-dependent oxidoreductase [Nakamurella sp. A5-74]|uniref:Molybdopterin-dependent oxidoreductase n=1 Tax=Nakamurella sp. A5-74 TaxID=3158264 RepID=A0AAU8DSH8_9ACTN